MLIEKDNSCLLLVDVQDKLTPLVLNKEKLVENCHWLLSLAKELNVTCCTTEQYPKGLGATVELLQPLIKSSPVLDKVTFSVMADPACSTHLQSLNQSQVIVMGIETSICVLQTVMDLLADKRQVFVVVDAVSGRNKLDGELALKRMENAGAILVTKEMVFFEWLRTAEVKNFKLLSKTYLQGKDS